MLNRTILVYKTFITLIKLLPNIRLQVLLYLTSGGIMYKFFLKVLVTASLFFTSTVSLAQIALEEMVVTSQKREQNLLDVPSALQAFSGSMLEGVGLRDTDDLTTMDPDMLVSGEGAGRAIIWLRGIGST